MKFRILQLQIGLVLEFEIWRLNGLKVITSLISNWIFGKHNWSWGMNQTLSAKVCTEIWCFWPLSASTTSEEKNAYAHVITQDICNKFIEVNFCVGCMVWWPNRLFQHSTTMSLINNIGLIYTFPPLEASNSKNWGTLIDSS